MARTSPVFICKACGGETLKWQGQCPHCAEWNSLEQRASARPPPRARSIGAVGRAASGERGRHPSATGDERPGRARQSAGRRHRAGLGDASGRGPRHRQVDAAPAGGGHVGASRRRARTPAARSPWPRLSCARGAWISRRHDLGVITENDLEAILATPRSARARCWWSIRFRPCSSAP